MTIALVVPTPIESKVIRREINPSPDDETNKICTGEAGGSPVLFSHCGIGKANAAHSVTVILENYDVKALILFGIGGAYMDSGLDIGDIAVAESESYGEEGVLTGDGWRSLEFIGFPLLKNEKEYYNTFPLDPGLMMIAANASKDCGFRVRSGNFVTVSQCSGTRLGGTLMKERWKGLCENMEGAAAAHICAMYGVPMVEVRGISNLIGDRNIMEWDMGTASSNCNKAVLELVKRLK